MLKIIEYLRKVNEKVEELSKKHKKYISDEDLLFAYRGESKDFGETKLMPSLFRKEEYVDKEKHLFELLCDYNIISNDESNINKAIEAQHYISISRMLDISFNVLVALYFVCDNYDADDGNLYIFGFPKHYSPHSKYIEDFYTNILDDKYISYSKNFKVFSHTYSNERIKAQKGGFIFFSGANFSPINKCYYEQITISHHDKKEIVESLKDFFAIEKASIFPEKENLSDVIRKRFDKNLYDLKTLNIDDEIETYFERLKYELKLNYSESGKEANEILRIIRKEEKDFLEYIQSIVSEEKQEKQDEIIEKFKLLKLEYTGS